MKQILVVLSLILAAGIVSCQQDTAPTKEPKVKPVVKKNGDYSEIIRIEDSILDDERDTVNVAKMTFDQTFFDFGTVKEGDIVEHAFVFTNTGKKPLLIRMAQSTCGCTVPRFNDKTPIEPGQTDSIVVRFDTKNKAGIQKKPITVRSNAYPNKVILYLRGKVETRE